MKRIISLLLAVLLLSAVLTAGAEEAGYVKEENTARDAVSYPYLIRTPSAVWHISKADIELLGEDAYYEGLYAVMDLAEADFADARAALEGYIFDEIPPIDIYTDFCNKGELSFIAWAYYDDTRNEIRLSPACAASLQRPRSKPVPSARIPRRRRITGRKALRIISRITRAKTVSRVP